MRTRLIPIGHSQGIRIPKPFLQQIGLEKDVDLQLGDGVLIISPVHHPRNGWEEAFEAMAGEGDDSLLLPEPFLAEEWDSGEWQLEVLAALFAP